MEYSTGEPVIIIESLWYFGTDRVCISRFYLVTSQCHVEVSGNPRKFSEISRKFSEKREVHYLKQNGENGLGVIGRRWGARLEISVGITDISVKY